MAVPLVVGGALIAAGKFNPADRGYLVTADLGEATGEISGVPSTVSVPVDPHRTDVPTGSYQHRAARLLRPGDGRRG